MTTHHAKGLHRSVKSCRHWWSTLTVSDPPPKKVFDNTYGAAGLTAGVPMIRGKWYQQMPKTVDNDR